MSAYICYNSSNHLKYGYFVVCALYLYKVFFLIKPLSDKSEKKCVSEIKSSIGGQISELKDQNYMSLSSKRQCYIRYYSTIDILDN